jgi:hypothetical protein
MQRMLRGRRAPPAPGRTAGADLAERVDALAGVSMRWRRTGHDVFSRFRHEMPPASGCRPRRPLAPKLSL